VTLRGRVDLSLRERLQRNLALDGPFLQNLESGLQSVLGGGAELDRAGVLGDRGLGALEVEALGDLARGLVDRVADLLHVDFRDDVERELVLRHGAVILRARPGGCPSGQRERSVKSPAMPTQV